MLYFDYEYQNRKLTTAFLLIGILNRANIANFQAMNKQIQNWPLNLDKEIKLKRSWLIASANKHFEAQDQSSVALPNINNQKFARLTVAIKFTCFIYFGGPILFRMMDRPGRS